MLEATAAPGRTEQLTVGVLANEELRTKIAKAQAYKKVVDEKINKHLMAETAVKEARKRMGIK